MEITVLSATWWALQAFLVYFQLEGAGKRWEAATSGTQVEYAAIPPDNNRTTSAWWTLNTMPLYHGNSVAPSELQAAVLLCTCLNLWEALPCAFWYPEHPIVLQTREGVKRVNYQSSFSFSTLSLAQC